jgi:hypothetical protein
MLLGFVAALGGSESQLLLNDMLADTLMLWAPAVLRLLWIDDGIAGVYQPLKPAAKWLKMCLENHAVGLQQLRSR